MNDENIKKIQEILNKIKADKKISEKFYPCEIKCVFDLIGETRLKNMKKSNVDIKNRFGYNSIEVSGTGIYSSDKPKEYDRRYYLEFDILTHKTNNKKSLLTLMMNPSNTFPKSKIDSTVKNVIRIATILRYSKIIVLNSLPVINSTGVKVKYSNSETEEINTEFIKYYLGDKELNKTQDFLIAFGANNEVKKLLNNNGLIDECINKRQNKYVYKKNSSNTPSHPGNTNTKYVYDFILGTNPQLIPINKIDKNLKIFP